MAQETVKCIHCGEDCGKYPIIWNEKPFCCNGCKTVFEILNQNKLYTYYEMESAPGIKLETESYSTKYAYLDNSEIADSLLDFKEESFSKISLYIPSIHCASCIWLLENLNKLHSGVISSSVNFTKKEVYISFKENEISLRQLVELLVSIHYIPTITLEKADKNPVRVTEKSLLLKIGIAGFGFGNIMLLTMPEYLPGGEHLESHFKQFFGYMNFALVLPVAFYSGIDYYISAYKGLKHKIINIDVPLAIGMVALFVQSAYEVVSQTGPGYFDSLAGLVFFLLLGKWYQSKTYQALSFERDYKSYFPVAVTKIENGKEESIALKDLKAGNRILIRNEELIPADGVLLSDQANIDYSFVTGESKPVKKLKGTELYAGGKQVGNAIEIEITKEVAQSRLTSLWNQIPEHDVAKTKSISKIIDTVSHRFTFIVIAVAIAAAGFWLLVQPNVALRAFTSVLIVACPCALALSAPFAFGGAMRIFGRKGFYLKKNDVVEKLAQVDTVVFDKTGTLTFTNQHTVNYTGAALTDHELDLLKSLTRQSAHPLSVALTTYLSNASVLPVSNYMEVPSGGIIGIIDSVKVKAGSSVFVLQQPESGTDGSAVYVSFDEVYKGVFSIKTAYRENIAVVCSNLQAAGYELHLISGDNDSERETMSRFFGSYTNLHFNQSPSDKLQYIKALKAQGKKVLMVGDGLNDAGALGEADAGISIADDIYRFSPACDAILEASRFSELSKFLLFNKKVLSILKTSFLISFLYNVVGISFAVRGLLSPIIAAILMPVSSITIVAFVTGMVIWASNKRLKL